MEKTIREQIADLRLQRDIVNLQVGRLQETCSHRNGWTYIDGNLGHPIYGPGDEYMECVNCGKIR